MEDVLKTAKERAKLWMSGSFDEDTKAQVKKMYEEGGPELIDAFYRHLEFGTGGLRGVMGPGTNRMNIYTVGMATQGLANYLKKQFAGKEMISVAIAYDTRNNSRLFAETAAGIFAANRFTVFLFDDFRPTPELSYAIRQFGCQSGVVITASHNPKEYNGYKVYWEDGGQIIPPHDGGIIEEVKKISGPEQVNYKGDKKLIKRIGEEFDRKYLDEIAKLSLSPRTIKKQRNMKIIYTPLHGTGVKLIPQCLEKFGFENVESIPEQETPDGNFPTVGSPNPEDPAAFEMAIKRGRETGALLILATDPDTDRVGVAVRDNAGNYRLLNGNQTAAIIVYYLLENLRSAGKLRGNEYIVKTIVTSDLISDIADKYGVECYDVLTGFKFIAGLMKELEGKKRFVAGCEESYGYLAGDFVRDKDAVVSSALICEITAWMLDSGKTLFDLLTDIYLEFGLYRELLVSLEKKGRSGAGEIAAMMEGFRNSPPDSICGSDVMQVNDYLKQKSFDTISHLRHPIDLPKSNVLQFFLRDGTKISVRPSGTEPKIKFYFSVNEKLEKREDFEKVSSLLDNKLESLCREFGIK